MCSKKGRKFTEEQPCRSVISIRKYIKSFIKEEQSGISINAPISDFSVDPSSINKEDILNINHYLMVKNNIKYYLGFLKKHFLYY